MTSPYREQAAVEDDAPPRRRRRVEQASAVGLIASIWLAAIGLAVLSQALGR